MSHSYPKKSGFWGQNTKMATLTTYIAPRKNYVPHFDRTDEAHHLLKFFQNLSILFFSTAADISDLHKILEAKPNQISIRFNLPLNRTICSFNLRYCRPQCDNRFKSYSHFKIFHPKTAKIEFFQKLSFFSPKNGLNTFLESN